MDNPVGPWYGLAHAADAVAVHAAYPAGWEPLREAQRGAEITSDQAVSADDDFYIKGLITLPLAEEPLTIIELGVWLSVSQDSFFDISDRWERPGRERDAPLYFGWLCTELQDVFGKSTLLLKTLLHTQPVGQRPLVELEDIDHPLAVAQRQGLSRADAKHYQRLLSEQLPSNRDQSLLVCPCCEQPALESR